MAQGDGSIIFRRIKGRIVPIRKRAKHLFDGAAGAGAVGATTGAIGAAVGSRMAKQNIQGPGGFVRTARNKRFGAALKRLSKRALIANSFVLAGGIGGALAVRLIGDKKRGR